MIQNTQAQPSLFTRLGQGFDVVAGDAKAYPVGAQPPSVNQMIKDMQQDSADQIALSTAFADATKAQNYNSAALNADGMAAKAAKDWSDKLTQAA